MHVLSLLSNLLLIICVSVFYVYRNVKFSKFLSNVLKFIREINLLTFLTISMLIFHSLLVVLIEIEHVVLSRTRVMKYRCHLQCAVYGNVWGAV